MPKYNETITVPLTCKEAMLACKEASANLNWRVMSEGDNFISCKENTSYSTFSITWPAKVDIYINEKKGKTCIQLKGSIMGLGPIQSGHLKGQVGKFNNLIELSLIKNNKISSNNVDQQSFVTELAKLSDLLENGILTQDEFNVAKKKIIGQENSFNE